MGAETENTEKKKNGLMERLFPKVWSEKRTRKIATTLIVSFTLFLAVAIILLITFVTLRFQQAMKTQAVGLTNELSSQMCVNLDNYVTTVEANAQMVFAEGGRYMYDPVAKKYSGLETIKIEQEITDTLRMQSRLRNYMDYCIAYSDGKTIGIVSDSTRKLYGKELYSSMRSAMGSDNSIWTTGYMNDYSMIYYAINVNENAVLVVSLYTHEFIDSLAMASKSDGMKLYLTDYRYRILHTNDDKAVKGENIPDWVSKRITRKAGTNIDGNYFVSVGDTVNKWHIIMVIPASQMFSSLRDTVVYVIIFSAVFIMIAFIMTVQITMKIVSNVNQTVHTLDVKAQIDLLTGILNKKSFEEIVNEDMQSGTGDYKYAMVFMDVDDFKHVNDKCGHDIGDEVLKFFARSMQRAFRENDIKGRLGGDEFCVLMKITNSQDIDVREQAEAACKRFYDILHSIGKTGRQEIPSITSSMGIAIAGENDKAFSDLYKKADIALYESKRAGKDRWTVYSKGLPPANNK